MRKKIFSSAVLFVALYVLSYIAISLNRGVEFSQGHYRIVSMHSSILSDETSFIVYKPIMRLDELTMGAEDSNLKPE